MAHELWPRTLGAERRARKRDSAVNARAYRRKNVFVRSLCRVLLWQRFREAGGKCVLHND